MSAQRTRRAPLSTQYYQMTAFADIIITPQPFYGPFSGNTRVSRCQQRTSGLYGARED